MNNLSKYFDLDILRKLDDYDRALVIVNELFKNITDKAGDPYLNHLYYVSNNLDTIEEKIVGLLHDTIEDTDITFYDLEDVGFNSEVIAALKLVTKIKGELYSDFIDRIINSGNLIALKVKIKDMENNMDPNRLNKLEEKQREKLEKKYNNEYKKLMKKLGEIKW